MKKLLLLIFLFSSFQPTAFAYLDPGTGSMLLSALVGILATLFFGLKAIYYKSSSFLLSLFGVKIEKNIHNLVFYSEGKSYWRSFKPVLEALDKKGIKAVYLTSSEDDEGLQFKSDYIQSRYIGTGNKAYTYLNMLEAKICVMTTPGLDVLQIRRSKGVDHYAHIVHAPTDMGLYKLYSFDYYDSIFCSGSHQKKSLRILEEKRNTKSKLLIDAGCPYIDELASRLGTQKNSQLSTDQKIKTVLVAPTWGNNGLLKRFGTSLLEPLLQQGYHVIIRPHPQSYIAEPELISVISEKLKHYKNISWDNSTDNFSSLMHSDIMISDLSGVIFDYAFVFEKPVITIEFELNWLGTEANDLPYQVWEIDMLDKIGERIQIDKINTISKSIENLLADDAIKTTLKDLREQSLYHYKHSGEVIANKLNELLSELQS